MTHYGPEPLPDRDPTPPYEEPPMPLTLHEDGTIERTDEPPTEDDGPPEPNNCIRCNAGMPAWRVNSLCEECYAEEQGDYDDEAEHD